MIDKPGPPQFWHTANTLDGQKEALRKTAQVVAQLQRGESNAGRIVTLRPDESTTEVLMNHARIGFLVLFSPQDAASAAEVAAGTIWGTVEDGKVIIHHGNSGTERKIGIALNG